MSPVEDTMDGIIGRWPKKPSRGQPATLPTGLWCRLSFAFWLVRLVVEGLGWLGILGLISRL